ncbi:cellulose biosynthesis protein BcsP [Acidovorax sp. sic0104]|uniref:cellulose biosynthesis protein BcsP n=1 Tax=Acidovorax sp. sic0104 TaxID=2854784 RepID=UPI001C467DA7|nr:cellulose biosynthesis protein BcsP [Acidovorax sp. sic0104]MBV7541623.1 hypothetical protein [Acidovorax sp. sic0104]
MKPSDDVVNLFQQFGGKPGPYKELGRQQEHQLSRERWPLVTAVQDAVTGDIPSVVRRGEVSVDPSLQVARPEAAPAAPSRPAPAAWAQTAQAPVAAPVAPMTQISPAAPAADYRAATVAPHAPAAAPAAAALAPRSPLAGLAGLRSAAMAAEPPAPAVPAALPADLPSVFARLAGTGSAAAVPGVQPAAPVWQPRRGPYP